MHPYLTRLQVNPEVQKFFSRFYTTDELSNLLFSYGDGFEHFGFAFHKVPLSANFWFAGINNFSQVRQVMICSSAMEAVSWLNKNYLSFSSPDNLLFLSPGTGVHDTHLRWLSQNLTGKTFTLVFGRDVLGRVADLKIAAGIRRVPVAVYFEPEEMLRVVFRLNSYLFRQADFSLNAFERAVGYRFNIPARKPKGFNSFFDQLKANAGLNFNL